MARLTPELEHEVLGKAAEGLGGPEIARWLLDKHGVKISRQALSKRIAKTRGERADLTKAVVREKLSKTLGGDLDELSVHSRRLAKLVRETPDDNTDRLVRLMEQHRKIVDTSLHYAGADDPETNTDGLAGLLALGFGAGTPRPVD